MTRRDHAWQRSNRVGVSLAHRGWQTINPGKGCLLAHRWLVRQTDYTYHVSTPCDEWGEFKRVNITLASNRTRLIVVR